MSKYIDADKLIAEIERLRNECAKSLGDGFVDGDLPKTMASGGGAWVCEQLLSFITSLQQEQSVPSCKTCGFYENNCPFIRGKLIPYPNKVCKDYTYSVMKDQPEVDLEKELDRWRHKHFKGKRDEDYSGEYLERESQLDMARHFFELGQRTKYQQDRAEFAKMKAKEWQEGYDEGYAKGLNARKEGAK